MLISVVVCIKSILIQSSEESHEWRYVVKYCRVHRHSEKHEGGGAHIHTYKIKLKEKVNMRVYIIF